MKRLVNFFIPMVVLGLAACNETPRTKTDSAPPPDSSTAATSTTESTPPPPPMDSAAMMKAWQAYMTPGEPHKILESQNGKWNEESTMWMAPGAPPTKSKMSCVNTMILGGRYQQSKHTGMMEGMPFEGISTVGYDNNKKMFVSTWVDNMGTGVMYAEGPWDPVAKTITLKGMMTDPMGGKDIAVREVMTIIDDKHQKMEMYNTPVGQQEYKCMEIMLTKQ